MPIKATAWVWRQDLRSPIEKLALLAVSDGAASTERIARICCANIHQTTEALQALSRDGIIVQESPQGHWYFAGKLRQQFDEYDQDGRG